MSGEIPGILYKRDVRRRRLIKMRESIKDIAALAIGALCAGIICCALLLAAVGIVRHMRLDIWLGQ